MKAQKGRRYKTKARIALFGPTNSGKSYTALLIATGLLQVSFPDATLEQIYDKIAVIDTERSRSLFYADRQDEAIPFKTGSFWHIPLDPPYSPARYKEALAAAQEAVGTSGVIIIDSLSHAWAYSGGILEIKEQIAKKPGVNSYTAWQEAGQVQNSLMDAILSTPQHLIVTMRSKMAYVLSTNEQGKTSPKIAGLEPIQRDDTEFEFDLTLELDHDTHAAKVIKNTTFITADVLDAITPDLGIQLGRWLEKGENGAVFKKENFEKHKQSVLGLAASSPVHTQIFAAKMKDLGYTTADQLTEQDLDTMDELFRRIEKK